MRASIADILRQPEPYLGKVAHIDGVLAVAAFNHAASQFEQVWIAQANTPNPLAIQVDAMHSESMLWHGLSRLSAPDRSGNQNFRVQDPARAWVKVLAGEDAPRLEIITAAVYRGSSTLYIGKSGLRLDQALGGKAAIVSVAELRKNPAAYLNRHCHVYGTLTLRAAPAAQYLSPGKIPYLTSPALQPPTCPTAIEAGWLDDIVYPQSNNEPIAAEVLRGAIRLDPAYGIAQSLSAFPGIYQTVVKPAIVEGIFVESAHEGHFGAMKELRSVYLQNICYKDGRKTFESVIKLKRFA